MKLKKIASLMLAGIMAVSMLAACGEGKDNGGNAGSSSSETPVAGYSADILDATGAGTKSLMDAEDDGTLNAAVKAAGVEVNNSSDLDFLRNFNKQFNENASNADVIRIRDAFVGNLNTDTEYVTSNSGKARVISENGKYVILFAFNREMTDAQIAGAVGNYIDDIMDAAVQNSGATKINYTLSAANVAVGTAAKGVVLVGIQIERTTTNG